MLRKSIQSSAGEPSFFYLIMAKGCFRRAASTRRPEGRDALRDIGRGYVARATQVASTLDRVGRMSEA